MPRELDILDALWRLFSSTQLAAALLLGIALASALSTLFPQVPSQATRGSIAYAQWLASAQARYGSWFGFLDTMGLFDVYGAWWFKALLALLALGLIVSTAERVASLWPMVHQVEIKPGADFFVAASKPAAFSVDRPVEQVVERLKARLTRRLCRTLVEKEKRTAYLYADRLWVEAASLLSHVGLAVILASAVVASRLGWQENAVMLSPGQSYEIGHGLDATLRFEKLELDTYPDGSLRDYRIHVQLMGDDTTVEQIIGVNRPLTYRGVSVYHVSHGMVVAVKASDQNGRPLPLQSFADGAETAAVVNLPFGGHQSERHFAVPDKDLVFRLVFYQSLPTHGYDGPVFLVQAYPGGTIEPIYSGFMDRSGALRVGDVTCHFALDQYTVLRIVRDPVQVVIVLGLLLTVVGYFLRLCSLFWPPVRLWAVVSEKGGQATLKLEGTVEHSWFENLVREMGEGSKGGK